MCSFPPDLGPSYDDEKGQKGRSGTSRRFQPARNAISFSASFEFFFLPDSPHFFNHPRGQVGKYHRFFSLSLFELSDLFVRVFPTSTRISVRVVYFASPSGKWNGDLLLCRSGGLTGEIGHSFPWDNIYIGSSFPRQSKCTLSLKRE